MVNVESGSTRPVKNDCGERHLPKKSGRHSLLTQWVRPLGVKLVREQGGSVLLDVPAVKEHLWIVPLVSVPLTPLSTPGDRA